MKVLIKGFIFQEMDCYLSQLLKMVNELSSIQSIKSAVDTMGET